METFGRDLLQAVFGTEPYYLPAKRPKPADDFAEKQLRNLEQNELEVLLINKNAVNDNVDLRDIFENLINNTSVKTIKLYKSRVSNDFIKTLRGTYTLQNAVNLKNIEMFFCDEETISNVLEPFKARSMMEHYLSSLKIDLSENQGEPISSYCVKTLTAFLKEDEGERLHKLILKAPMNTKDIFDFMKVARVDKNLQTLEFEPIFMHAMHDEEKKYYDQLKKEINRRMSLNRRGKRIPIERNQDGYESDGFIVKGIEDPRVQDELREYLKEKEEENKEGQTALENFLKYGTQPPRRVRNQEEENRYKVHQKLDLFLDDYMTMDEFIEFLKEERRRKSTPPEATGGQRLPRLLPVRRG